MKIPKKILIVVQRSNGDVFLSSSLVKNLYDYYQSPKIDLLVNDDTIGTAKMIPYISQILRFSYEKKSKNQFQQEKLIFKSIYRKYDLSISLTSSDRSVIYALIASKKSIASIEKKIYKSWWKKLLLTYHYYYDQNRHILIHNLEPLKFLEIACDNIMFSPQITESTLNHIRVKFKIPENTNFIIFHPSAQYEYKLYPKNQRHELIKLLSSLGVLIFITGGSNKFDNIIKRELVSYPNIINLIGKTTLEEYFALSQLSSAYIGMDTLNMHIAAAQSKRIFAIFGPTKLEIWSPWSNVLKTSTDRNLPIQNYGNITIFQANFPCVACGNMGCDNTGFSKCLNQISPYDVFKEVNKWYVEERV